MAACGPKYSCAVIRCGCYRQVATTARLAALSFLGLQPCFVQVCKPVLSRLAAVAFPARAARSLSLLVSGLLVSGLRADATVTTPVAAPQRVNLLRRPEESRVQSVTQPIPLRASASLRACACRCHHHDSYHFAERVHLLRAPCKSREQSAHAAYATSRLCLSSGLWRQLTRARGDSSHALMAIAHTRQGDRSSALTAPAHTRPWQQLIRPYNCGAYAPAAHTRPQLIRASMPADYCHKRRHPRRA